MRDVHDKHFKRYQIRRMLEEATWKLKLAARHMRELNDPHSAEKCDRARKTVEDFQECWDEDFAETFDPRLKRPW